MLEDSVLEQQVHQQQEKYADRRHHKPKGLLLPRDRGALQRDAFLDRLVVPVQLRLRECRMLLLGLERLALALFDAREEVNDLLVFIHGLYRSPERAAHQGNRCAESRARRCVHERSREMDRSYWPALLGKRQWFLRL